MSLNCLLPPSGEDGAAEEAKDGKTAKAKRSHFGRAVSLKNFILRKGKSTSVDLGEGAKEEEEVAEDEEGEEAAEEGGADGEAAAASEETNDKDAAEVEKSAKEPVKEAEKTPAEAPVTNGENGCSNGTAEENSTHNHQEEEKTTETSPVKKTKEAAGAKDEANAKIINATAAVNSGELQHADRNSDQLQNSCSSKEGETNNRRQPASLTNDSSKQTSCQETELALALSREEGAGAGGEAPQNGGRHDGAGSYDRGEREGEDDDEMRKRDLREAAVAIVQNVVSAAADQLERELGVVDGDGINGCDVTH